MIWLNVFFSLYIGWKPLQVGTLVYYIFNYFLGFLKPKMMQLFLNSEDSKTLVTAFDFICQSNFILGSRKLGWRLYQICCMK